ncbi:MAG: hypothetical protein IPL61_37045 [Myxococcales bacterium]|nr:hypothetical protein [Myxococcales bacterium]
MSSSNPLYDFAQEADFATLSPLIRSDVCGSPHAMPHAERVMKKFWASGARALLISAYPPPSYPEPLLACKP